MKLGKTINIISIISLIFAAIILTLFIAYFNYIKIKIMNYIVKPIELIANSLESLSEKSNRLPTKKSHLFEINTLANSINEMLAKKAEYENRLTYLAYHDLETGMHNYQYIIGHINSMLAATDFSQDNLVVCCIYIKNMADINHIWGKEIADNLIADLFDRLDSNDKTEITCAKISTSNHIIAFKKDKKTQGNEIANMIISLLNQQRNTEKELINLDYKLGIIINDNPNEQPDQIITKAVDAAAILPPNSKAKFKIFEHEDSDRLKMNAILANDIFTAIKESQIEIYYQPQQHIKDRVISGCEALVRWKHPIYGSIAPLHLIQLAERSGEIIELGRYIQREALKNYSQWLKWYDHSFKLSINASLFEVLSPYFADHLRSLLTEFSIDANLIEIEITETQTSLISENFNDVIASIKEIGVKVSIDDFGTGYSSLSRAKLLNVDLIKIDKSFIDNITTSNHDRKFLSSIINMCQTINVPTLAEGVETNEQFEILKELGCDYIQGYLLSKPLSKTDMEDFLKKHKA